MIADLKPYGEYKDSGLPSLGLIPKHWRTNRLKNWVSINTTVLSEGTNPGFEFEYIDIGAVGTGFLTKSPSQQRFGTAPSRARRTLSEGDTIISTVRTYLKAVYTVKRVGIPLVASTGFAVLRPRPTTNPRFVGLLVQSPYFINLMTSESVGIAYPAISETALSNILIAIPPPEEQAAIVRFLDWANGRLDRAIRAKRKVIALLNEQKQAIIHQAVTRGLDPSVSLKPSGVPWLGEIPNHWETPLFGRLLTKIEQGWSPVAAEGDLESDQWAVLTLSSVRRGTFNPFAIKPISRTATVPTNIEVHHGDLLLTRSNTRDRVGDICIACNPRPKTLLCDLIYRLILRRDAPLLPEFVVHQLLSRVGRGQIERDARGSSETMPKISQGHIKSWRILLPPIEEQRQIVARITDVTSPADLTINRLEREIDLFVEYRTRLTADVVTGKLDVREFAATLPEPESHEEYESGEEELLTDEDEQEAFEE